MTKDYELSTGKKIKVNLVRRGESNKWGGWHDVYQIIFNFDTGRVTSTFHNSIVNFGKPVDQRIVDDAVNCVCLDATCYDAYSSFHDFMDEFGYDYDDKEGNKVYRACESIYMRLNKYLTNEELYELESMTA